MVPAPPSPWPKPRPHPAYRRLAEQTGSFIAPAALRDPDEEPPAQAPRQHRPQPADAPAAGGNRPAPVSDCACGQVCVCHVPLSVLRPLVSYFAAMHHGNPCACGEPVCGFATYTTRLFDTGAFFRA